jgi:cation transport ATPase
MTDTYDITGMHCQNCATKITAALERAPGVGSAAVTRKPPQAAECSKHKNDHCRECAAACTKCAIECRAIAKA